MLELPIGLQATDRFIEAMRVMAGVKGGSWRSPLCGASVVCHWDRLEVEFSGTLLIILKR
jgi:hypothetical protein